MQNNWTIHQPLRLIVSQLAIQKGRLHKGRGADHRGAYCAITPTTIAYIYWTADTRAEPWREGFGSFLLADIHATRRAVEDLLANPATRQIQIRTNQDQTWFVINKHADGTSTIYDAREDR